MSMRIKIQFLLLFICALFLSGCSTFFDKDNSPEPKSLVQLTPTIKPHHLWTVKTGGGVGNEQLKNAPAISGDSIYTSSANGTVTAVDKNTGRIRWKTSTGTAITTGPGTGDGLVVVASRHGKVAALDAENGTPRWNINIPGEALAAPAIARGRVVIKTVDGHVRAFSTQNGKRLWSFQQVEPNFVLRGASSPIIHDQDVLLGFANGNLAKLSLANGQLAWTQAIATPEGAFTIQRMIDIDADPILYGSRIYAATYQGKIASLNWYTGRTLWSHKISSYTGMNANAQNVFISDAKSNIWSFNANNGVVNWRQTDLEWRNISGPAILDNYVIVGDAQGFLHWMNAKTGHFAARTYAGGPIYASPITKNNVLYVLTSNGRLSAYTV